MKGQIIHAVEERIGEGQTGRLRALLVAAVAGLAAAFVTYQMLRGHDLG